MKNINKKYINIISLSLVLFIMVFFNYIYSDNMSTTTNLWNQYYVYNNKIEEAFKAKDIAALKDYTDKAVKILIKLNRNDIIAWKLNNLGYYIYLIVSENSKNIAKYKKDLETALAVLLLAKEKNDVFTPNDTDKARKIDNNIKAVQSLLQR